MTEEGEFKKRFDIEGLVIIARALQCHPDYMTPTVFLKLVELSSIGYLRKSNICFNGI